MASVPVPRKQRLLQQIDRSARLKVINELKRTQGLGVSELAARLGMSYMGVKGVCLDLEKRGLLDTWRQPQKLGRPQLLYRLTERAHELFPTESNGFTLDLLEAAQRLFGASAPEKLLWVVFEKQREKYAACITGSTLEDRVEQLARIRDQEGCMAQCFRDGAGWKLTEYHSPILDVLRSFPVVLRFEAEMFERLLGAPVRRVLNTASGLFEATFFIG
jgi:predicted ArsR family transcriptional regulator